MFCVLHIESPQSPRPKWLRRFQKPVPPRLEKVPIRGGAFFYEVTLFRNRYGEADLSILPQLVGGSAQRILPCSEIETLPEPLRLFRPSLFLSIVYLNSAQAFLEADDTPPAERVLGVCDPDARLQAALRPFVNLAKTVKVYTRRPQSYDAMRAELLSETGLSLIVSAQRETLSDCTVVLDPFAEIGGQPVGTLTLRKCGKVVLAGESVQIPAEYAERCPQGVDPFCFAAALYELCGRQGLQTLRYTRFTPIPYGS